MTTNGIARFRVDGDEVVRQSPPALTRAGFLYEWLHMNEGEAALWGEPAAREVRNNVVSVLKGHGFEWKRVARCEGSTPVWEVTIQVDESKRVFAFRIGGEHATDLRMLEILDRHTESCVAVDITKSLTSIAAELPW